MNNFRVINMIFTSSYKNFNTFLYKRYSISGDKGKNASYIGPYYKDLSPKKSFQEVWHKNIDVISKEENDKYYVEEYYKQVLQGLDPREAYEQLNGSVLLCYEDENEFCHRHIVASWFNLCLGVEVKEIKLNDYGISYLERPTNIRKYLEETIKRNKNMMGFTSIRAAYLFEQSEKLEQKANELEKNRDRYCDTLRQAACYLRCDADEIESEYKIKIKEKRK